MQTKSDYLHIKVFFVTHPGKKKAWYVYKAQVEIPAVSKLFLALICTAGGIL